MSSGNDNPLPSRLWTTYQAHRPNHFSLVITLKSLIRETTLSSTGTFGQLINPKGWGFQKEIEQKCTNIFNSLRRGCLTPSRWQFCEDSGLPWGSSYLFWIFYIDGDHNLVGKCNLCLRPKSITPYIRQSSFFFTFQRVHISLSS